MLEKDRIRSRQPRAFIAALAVNAATELVSDAETLELIQALDAEFYGPEEESSSRSFHRGTMPTQMMNIGHLQKMKQTRDAPLGK